MLFRMFETLRKDNWKKTIIVRDVPGGPEVKNLSASAGNMVRFLVREAPHSEWQLSPFTTTTEAHMS